MAKNNEIGKPAFAYRCFKAYVRFLHDKILYRKTYTLHKEAIQPAGVPQLIVSNHQNCLNDPLGILFAFTDRKANFITRADVFALSPVANKFLRSIGLLPAFRLGWEGEAALGKNEETFKISEEALVNGNTVAMFPEGGHQDKRWLGYFSQGYLKLAFEAAEMGNFEKEIFILPSCNHYSNYFGIQNRFLVKFGTPISLKPYYERYKTKPRTVKREVNQLVRQQIEELMLNINDLENYEEIYFLCHEWGNEYAASKGINPDYLPDKLLVEKEIVAKLDAAKAEDEAGTKRIYEQAKALQEGIGQMGIRYGNLVKAPKRLPTLLWTLLLLVASPLFAVSLVPAWFIYELAMQLFKHKAKDPMFNGTFLLAITALFGLPVFGGLTFVLLWMYTCIWFALIYTALIPAFMLFAWHYKERVKSVWQDWKCIIYKERARKLMTMKEKLSEAMKKIVNTSKRS